MKLFKNGFLYVIIISAVMFTAELSTILVSCLTNSISLTYAIVAPFILNIYMLGSMGLFALLMRVFYIKKLYNYNNFIYRISDIEIKFYNKIKIKKWKDKVPEMGWTGGFPKDKIQSTDINYISKFIEETCFAELLHLISAVFGLTIFLFMPIRDLYFTIPIAVTNIILNLLPYIIQRYNRNRLISILCKLIVKEYKDE